MEYYHLTQPAWIHDQKNHEMELNGYCFNCGSNSLHSNQFSSVQLLSRVQLFATPWTTARQTSLSITNSRSASQFSCSVVSNSFRPHEPQHSTPPCPSPTPRVHPNPCPLSRWCHPTISSSVIRFSSCPQSFPALGSFQMSQLFSWGGQSIGVSASTSVLPMNIQDCSPLGWTDWISLQSKGLSRVFSNTTVQKH